MVKEVFLVIGFSLLIAMIVSFILAITANYKNRKNLALLSSILGFVYLTESIMSFLWYSDILPLVERDILLLRTMFIVVEASLIIGIIYFATRRSLLILMEGLIFGAAITEGIQKRIGASLIIAEVALIAAFLLLLMEKKSITKRTWKKRGISYLEAGCYLGLIYGASLIILTLLKTLNAYMSPLWALPPLMIAGVLLILRGYISILSEKTEKKGGNSMIIMIIKGVLYEILIVSLLFVATLSIHELGHSLTATSMGCRNVKAVIFSTSDFPHSEIKCEGMSNIQYRWMIINGMLAPVIIGLFFLLLGDKIARTYAMLIIGFAFLMMYGDLKDIGVSINMIATVIISAFIMLTAGIYNLGMSTFSISNVKNRLLGGR